jgi:UDP-glucose 4-epimerase
MRVLVAGGLGFLGKEVSRYLANKGYDVIVVDPVAEGSYQENFMTIKGTINNPNILRDIGKVDFIVHSAWDFTEDLGKSISENLIGSSNLCEWAASLGVKKFVFYSSSVIYGIPIRIPITEDHPLLVEKSRAPLHALIKLYVEKLLFYYYYQKSLPITIFRIWWSYSDYRAPGRTYRDILSKVKRGEKIEVPMNAGGSIVYTGDLAEATKTAFYKDEAVGEIFNISSFYLKWVDVLKKIAMKFGSSSEISEVEGEWKGPGFLEGSWLLDDSKLRNKLGLSFNSIERENRFIEVSQRMLNLL